MTTYQTLVERLWADGKLGPEGLATLATLQAQLGMSRADAEAIERGVMGRTKEEALSAAVSAAVATPPAAGLGASSAHDRFSSPASTAPGGGAAQSSSAFGATFSGGRTLAPGELDARGPGAAPGAVLRVGDLIAGRFEVLAALGEGGMGQVLKVQDRKLDVTRAMKVIRPDLIARPDIQERFKIEVRTCQALTHPHIVRVYDYDEDEARNLRFFTMEFVEGQTLRQWLGQKRGSGARVSLEEFTNLATRICDALAYIHRHTIHRDLKPDNIIVNWQTDSLKLMDFGIAKAFGQSSRLMTQGPTGTPYYMAPETEGGGAVDARADIYSAGVMFYELLTGELPRAGSRPLAQVRPDLPASLSSAITRAMAVAPGDRFSTVMDFAAALRVAPPTAPRRAASDVELQPPPADDSDRLRENRTRDLQAATAAAKGVGGWLGRHWRKLLIAAYVLLFLALFDQVRWSEWQIGLALLAGIAALVAAKRYGGQRWFSVATVAVFFYGAWFMGAGLQKNRFGGQTTYAAVGGDAGAADESSWPLNERGVTLAIPESYAPTNFPPFETNQLYERVVATNADAQISIVVADYKLGVPLESIPESVKNLAALNGSLVSIDSRSTTSVNGRRALECTGYTLDASGATLSWRWILIDANGRFLGLSFMGPAYELVEHSSEITRIISTTRF